MTVAKDGAKLTEAKAPDAPNNCKYAQDKAAPGQCSITCTSETMTQFVSMFGGVFPHHVIDHTGLNKSYDFTLKFAFGQMRTRTTTFASMLIYSGNSLDWSSRPRTCHSPPLSSMSGPDPNLRTSPTSQS